VALAEKELMYLVNEYRIHLEDKERVAQELAIMQLHHNSEEYWDEILGLERESQEIRRKLLDVVKELEAHRIPKKEFELAQLRYDAMGIAEYGKLFR